MNKIYFITSNRGKLQEAVEKLRPFGFSVIQKDLGYPEIQAEKLQDVAYYGIEYLQKRFTKPFILEDAGLFINALHGFPGVYSKYVFFTIGLPGILQLLKTQKNRNAIFRSIYAYSQPGNKPIIFFGQCKGTISTKQRGKNGFGYDPIFIPIGARKTFGEMTVAEKNRYSHRSKALDQFVICLKKKNLM